MSDNKYKNLKATPEKEDFKGKYESTGRIGRYLVDNYFKSVENLLNRVEITSALEIGCGAGISTARLKKLLGNKVKLKASEYVDELVGEAKKLNPDIDIIQESVYELQHRDESVDLVFLLEVLEHLDYPEDALKEIKRVSSKYLILGVPREPIWRILNFLRLKYIKDFGNTPGHLNHWSRRGLIKFVEAHYGKVIAVESPLPWTIVLAEKYK